MKYDVLVIGAGPAGIACARELKNTYPNAKVCIIEKGHPISKRRCPSQEKKIKCINCNVCAVLSGFGGSGANSDGKFTMPQKPGPYHIGGTLPTYIGLEETNRLIWKQHNNNMAMGAPNNIITKRDDAFIKDFDEKLRKVGLFRADADINHIGTSGVRELYQAYEDELKKLGVEISFDTEVTDILLNSGRIIGVILSNGARIKARNIVLATGRSGSKWMEEMTKKHDIAIEPEEVDFGIRVEVPARVMELVDKNLYEAKIIGEYGNVMVRMFCTNPYGAVVCETADGIKYVNGHADNVRLSENTNFAVLASYKVNDKNPSRLVRNIAKLINNEGDGQPIVQRWGDLKMAAATSKLGLELNSVTPSLRSATPGNMTTVFPEKALTAIKQYMNDLGKVIQGIDNDDTLAYGLEAKFCHSGLALNNVLECSIGAYVIGDAGPTHGLASAAASGIHVAHCIKL